MVIIYNYIYDKQYERNVMNYYYLSVKETKIYGIAYVSKGTDLFPLPEAGLVDVWDTMLLTLKDGPFSDYIANDRCFNLCSRKLRDVIDKSKSGYDELQWLPAKVRSEEGEQREYFIMHLPRQYDVLDRERTVYGPQNTIIKPVISRRLAEKHDVFTFIGGSSVRLFISERVKKNIQTAKCKGVVFERAAATD